MSETPDLSSLEARVAKLEGQVRSMLEPDEPFDEYMAKAFPLAIERTKRQMEEQLRHFLPQSPGP